MKWPTIWRRAEGRARRTSNPPRSRARGTITVSIASQAKASPGTGWSAGWWLIATSGTSDVGRRRNQGSNGAGRRRLLYLMPPSVDGYGVGRVGHLVAASERPALRLADEEIPECLDPCDRAHFFGVDQVAVERRHLDIAQNLNQPSFAIDGVIRQHA